MAYLRDLERRHCQELLCSFGPQVELIDDNGDVVGTFCRSCGERRLQELLRAEREDSEG